MGVGRMPYDSLDLLLLDYLSTDEWEDTAVVMRQLRPARRRGYLTPADLERVCRWKSPRAIQHIRSNTPRDIRAATRQALATRNERRRLEALTTLRGVSVPMASAALTLLNPRRYGVIDIRAWQLLHSIGAVTKRPAGIGFTFEHWEEFLTILRRVAARHRVKARDVERALFLAHRDHQEGRLYR